MMKKHSLTFLNPFVMLFVIFGCNDVNNIDKEAIRQKTKKIAIQKCEKYNMKYVEHKQIYVTSTAADVTCKVKDKHNTFYFYDHYYDRWEKISLN